MEVLFSSNLSEAESIVLPAVQFVRLEFKVDIKNVQDVILWGMNQASLSPFPLLLHLNPSNQSSSDPDSFQVSVISSEEELLQ